jgi:hypothetical protein
MLRCGQGVILQKWEFTKKDEQLAVNDVGADRDRDRDRKDITFLQRWYNAAWRWTHQQAKLFCNMHGQKITVDGLLRLEHYGGRDIRQLVQRFS